jgi:adenine-specific DNA-methyltransferase
MFMVCSARNIAIGQNLGISSQHAVRSQNQAESGEGAARILATVDREIARALSAPLAERHRLSFARSFTFAVLQDCQGAMALPPTLTKPQGFELVPLSTDAAAIARQFGAKLAEISPRQAAHLAGSFTRPLPEDLRAAHGIFYTPPALADQLLVMAEEASIDWATARVLDPACGGGAFLVPLALRIATTLHRSNPAFILQNIAARLHGFELDPFGAWLAQVAVELALPDVIRAAGKPLSSIVEVKDSLDIKPADIGRFDLVVGNPPYGRVTLPPQRRAFF